MILAMALHQWIFVVAHLCACMITSVYSESYLYDFRLSICGTSWDLHGPTYIFLFFKRWFPRNILGKFPKSLYTLFFNGCSNLHPFFWRPCHRLISGMSGRYGEQQVCQTHFCSWPGLVAMVFRMVYVPPFYPGYVCGICAPIEMMSLEKKHICVFFFQVCYVCCSLVHIWATNPGNQIIIKLNRKETTSFWANLSMKPCLRTVLAKA